MATWIEVNLNLEKLDKSQVKKLDNGTFYRVLVKVVDEYKYGKNAYAITSYPQDAQPENEHKVGNGKVVFTTGTIEKAVPEEEVKQAPVQAEEVTAEDDINLPF